MTELALPIGTIGVSLLMAAVTYFWRAAGFWSMGLFDLTPRLRRGLEALPGAIIVATLAPIIVRLGPGGLAAVATAVVAMVLIRSPLAAIVLGVAAAALTRLAL